LPVAIPVTIALAWCIAAFAQFTGAARFLHHHALIEGGPPLPASLGLFVAAWLVMIAAMMLPSSVPLMRLFVIAAANQPRPWFVFASCRGGYVVVWCAFGLAAFGGDVALHRTIDRVAWLGAHSWLIGGSVLALAGAFQFAPLQDQCLRACRLPSNFLMHHDGRGAPAAFRLGYRHGLFCVGCCWALMLVSFATGFASLWWMAVLTALMVFEKSAPRGRFSVPITGAVFLVWSAVIFVHPAWLPAAFSG
ncbi:MAG: DUF2182 domain-containing protein, partial [Candidatus Eremiobacteraeota bacterium]|nr:DUF2182 domain-containing protein [Candidatus Eremiobacteraeota bacterium]